MIQLYLRKETIDANVDIRLIEASVRKAIAARVKYYVNPQLSSLDPRFVYTDFVMFIEVGIPVNAEFIKTTILELCKLQHEDGSWYGDLWQTAEAVKILQIYIVESGDSSPEMNLERGLSWIKKDRESNNSWYDEIWETLFAVSALQLCKQYKNTAVSDYDLDASIQWLLDHMKEGHLINYHFSGILLSILSEYDNNSEDAQLKYSNSRETLRQWFLQERTLDNKKVWSEEVYANCYATLGLISSHMEFNGLSEVVRWLIDKQNNRTGEWESDRREASSLATKVLLRYFIHHYVSYLTESVSMGTKQLAEIAKVIKQANEINLNLEVGVTSLGEYVIFPRYVRSILILEISLFSLTGIVFFILWLYRYIH